MKEEIDKRIKAYYNSKSLSKDQMDRIIGKQKKKKNSAWSSILKYAAVFCIAIACFFLYQSSKTSLSEKYGKEVAFNHLKNLESDILSSNVSELNNKMNKLNFEIHIPQDIDKKFSLLGGRYCSIDERLAAQLKLKDKTSDSVVTLYVLDKLKSESFDESFLIDSTAIQIWNEKSNLFVLASNTSK